MATSMSSKSDFRDETLPHLADLLRFALWLTKSGRTATMLLRESLAEAFRTWDVTGADEGHQRLRKILIKRFHGLCDQTGHEGFQESAESSGAYSAPRLLPLANDSITLAVATGMAPEKDNDTNYLKAVAELPAVFRSAIVMSHLEDFSTSDNSTRKSDGPPRAEELLDRGRSVLQARLYDHLMDTEGVVGVDDRKEASS